MMDGSRKRRDPLDIFETMLASLADPERDRKRQRADSAPVLDDPLSPSVSEPLFNDDDDDDDEEDDYEDLSPEEIEQRDAELALVLSCAFGELPLAAIPPHLHSKALKQMRKHGLKPDVDEDDSNDVIVISQAEWTEREGERLRKQKEEEEIRKRQEKADEAYARKLFEEINGVNMTGVKAAAQIPTTAPRNNSVLLEEQRAKEAERMKKLKQDEDDAALARKLQHEFDREAHEESLSIARSKTKAPVKPDDSMTKGEPFIPPLATAASFTTPPSLPRAISSSSAVSAAPNRFGLPNAELVKRHLAVPPRVPSSGLPLPSAQAIAALFPQGVQQGLPSPSRVNPTQFARSPVRTVSEPLLSQSQKSGSTSTWGVPAAPSTRYRPPPGSLHGLTRQFSVPPKVESYPGAELPQQIDPDDMWERPLQEKEVEEQLKNLLENAAAGADETPKEKRIPSPPDLKVTLLEHQKIGVEWMLNMEKGSNMGGILADDMGLGKTIQSISCCILNRSTEKDMKTTLIVAPTSLIYQWRDELASKVRPGLFRVYVYYGKEKKAATPNLMRQYDIVITTYGTLAQEFPQVTKTVPKDPFSSKEDQDKQFEADLIETRKNKKMLELKKGNLFKVQWFRVILDEGHTIKNKATRAARAASFLDARYRWCLTGTPLQNNIGELYSLINFLKIKPYCSWEQFRDSIEKPFKAGRHKRAIKRVQALLKSTCLRRNKTSTLDGAPIIYVPPKTMELREVDFTKEEREFYTSLEKRTLLRFNKYLKEGTVMQNYSNILVLLLRLRQACCHPSLVAQHFQEASPETLKAAEAEQSNTSQTKPAFSDLLDAAVLERLKDPMNNIVEAECPICVEPANDGRILAPCGHIFCADCIALVLDRAGNQAVCCPSCRGPLDRTKLIPVTDFCNAFAINRGADDLEDEEPNQQGGGSGPEKFISSTKIDQTIEILVKTRNERPEDKTIIFSQFRGMMDLLETPLRERNIGFVRYEGSMNADERERAVQKLQNDKDVRVILVSLKCGSLGLNLTCCNHVIIIDFWWNVAIENQAIDRAHRLGQQKEVFVNRVTIKNTVEERILKLQKEKQELFNAALGEGGVGGLSRQRLGLNDLIKLFGANGQDDDE